MDEIKISIPLAAIKERCMTKTFRKAQDIKDNNKVYGICTDLDDGQKKFHASAEVEGSSGGIDYHVWIDYDTQHKTIRDYECECPAFFSYPLMCKHCAALALQFAEENPEYGQPTLERYGIFGNKQKELETSPQLSKLIYNYSMEKKARFLQPDITGSIELEPILRQDYRGWKLGFKIGGKYKYVLKDIHGLLVAVQNKENVTYGKKLGFIHEKSAFTEESQRMLQFLQKYLDEYSYFRSGGNYYYVPAMRELDLSDEARGEFYHLMSGKVFCLNDLNGENQLMEVREEDPLLKIKLASPGRRQCYSLILPGMEALFAGQRLYLRMQGIIYECSGKFSEDMGNLCTLGSFQKKVSLDIAQNDMSAFCSSLLLALQKYARFETEEDLERYTPEEAVIKVYLDYEKDYITGKLEAEYGEKTYNLLGKFDMKDAYRDTQKESCAVRVAEGYFEGTSDDDRFWINADNEDAVYRLLTTGMEQIGKVAEVYVSDAFKRLKITGAPKVSVGVSVQGGLLDLTIDTGRMSREDLERLLLSYKKRKKFFRMKNGSFMELKENPLSVVSELADGLQLKAEQLSKGNIQIPKYRAFYLDQVLKNESADVYRDNSFKSMIRSMRDVEDSDYEVPDALKEVMRNYQKTGYRWLCTLAEMGFGGILADDMGLGKTLQVIGFLLRYKHEKEDRSPGLVVCPASLVYNWENEIEKFAPELKALVLAGSLTERKNLFDELKDFDVVITSYDLLKRDIEEYQGRHFYVQIIDEAQNIKNYNTQASKAVKLVDAEVKFALTGTPIENRLSELWSIFDYLMPGFLGVYQRFKKEYETPIVQNKDEVMTRRLQKMIKPFILRRIKADVLKDLPDKEEQVVYSKLEGEQEALYRASVQRLMDSLNKTSSEKFQSEKLQILAELMRLRQICCAPGMVYENYKGGSAKLDTCMELLRNAVESGHKVLVFSQFTSLFEILEKELNKEKMAFYKLTGAVGKQKRIQLVTSFNENDVPVFLISLKAGGTGLNLTGASIVIHLDPWWNAAAESQATDRAHRIGQKNTVSVFKLIAKNTIEEKILKLQEAKKDLSDQIISGEGISASNLTREDFMGILEMS